jgi:exonuclease VII small subunit
VANEEITNVGSFTTSILPHLEQQQLLLESSCCQWESGNVSTSHNSKKK